MADREEVISSRKISMLFWLTCHWAQFEISIDFARLANQSDRVSDMKNPALRCNAGGVHTEAVEETSLGGSYASDVSVATPEAGR